MDLSGVGVWAHQLRYGEQSEVAEAAAELEELGFSALWIPDTGGPVFDAVEHLLASTTTTVVATGILNLWMHEPADVAAAYHRLVDAHGERFLVGIGVSHAPLIDAGGNEGRYRKPLASTAAFLDALDAAERPVPASARALAALGPKMLALAAERTRGVHPYLVTPEHTAVAREAVGPDSLVLPEQTVILCADADEARTIGVPWLKVYLGLPNYANNLLRLGFTREELDAVDQRVFDAVIAWGDEDAVAERVQAHRAAGADHVCVQVLTGDQGALARDQWRRLAPALV